MKSNGILERIAHGQTGYYYTLLKIADREKVA